MRRKCALCNAPARLYCHSDHAFVCWDCDSRVHSANFLAARHLRNLLCGVCHSSTPWNASGARLGQIVSICTRCVDACDRTKVTGSAKVDERRRKENEEDGESQVVTSSDESSPHPPPPAASSSSSSSQESSNRFRNCDRDDSLKRMRENNNDDDDDDAECCSSSSLRRTGSGSSDSTRARARALKVQRLEQYEEPVMIKKKKIAQDHQRRL